MEYIKKVFRSYWILSIFCVVLGIALIIDPKKICSMYEYFEIFLGRMMMCRGAAEVLGATFKLTANGSKVL